MFKDYTTQKDVESYVSHAIRAKDDVNIPIVFAVNKIDLGDDFSMEYIYNAVKNTGASNYSIVKTSAKTGEGVTELFEKVVRKARIGNVNTMECIKKILSMDKDILQRKKCLVWF